MSCSKFHSHESVKNNKYDIYIFIGAFIKCNEIYAGSKVSDTKKFWYSIFLDQKFWNETIERPFISLPFEISRFDVIIAIIAAACQIILTLKNIFYIFSLIKIAYTEEI